MDGGSRVIVGRGVELEAVERMLANGARAPAALVLEGEAGIGKTTIWLSGVEEARRRASTVLVARPAEGEISLPFAALGDLLGPVVDAVAGDLPAPRREALDLALHRVKAHEPATALAVACAVAELLRVLAARGALVVAVDDAQWLDPPTERALAFALRRLPDVPVRVLITVRRGSRVTVPLALDQPPLAQAVSVVRVAPMEATALGALLRERLDLALPRPRLRELHRLCAGNPFYALEIGRALHRAESRSDHDPLPVPENLGELLRLRLAGLSEHAREAVLMAAASTHPRAAAIERAAGDAGGLAEAVRMGVLQFDDERLRFSHPLLASVACGSAAPWERRDAHRRLAAVVTDAEERARHLALATTEPHEGVAAALEVAAAQAGARGAPEAAADLLERAADLSPDIEAGRRRRAAAVDHHIAGGDTARARAILERLVADHPPGPGRADLLRRLADAGDSHVASLAIGEQALAEARGDPAITAAVHLQLATLTSVAGDPLRAIEHTRAAAQCAERAGDDALVAMTLADLCSRLMYLGLPYSQADMDRALDIERRLDGIPAFQNPSFRFGSMLVNADEPERARPLLQAGLARLEQAGNAGWQIGTLFRLVDLELRTGDWRAADALARRAVEIAETAGIAQEHSIALMSHGLVQAHLGHLDEARDAASRALAIAEAAADRGFAIRAAGVLGFAALSAGEPEAALRHLEPAAAELRRTGVGELSVHHVAHNEIEALVAVGRLDEAERAIAYVEEKGRPTGRSWHAAMVARGRALVAAAHGDLEAARAHVDDALVVHRRLPQPFELGRTLLVQGMIERRAKRRAAARDALMRAVTIFEALGAAAWAAKAAAELARIPGRRRDPGGLTETERRVAALVADGLSNKEVAARLFVSVRAVEVNLSKVYAKLGIRSRTELARRMGDRREAH
jgi:DNA-binding CsgD family transcriptional regulator